MAQGFFAIDILAELQTDHRDGGVMMIGRGDENGVHVFGDFVVHDAVVGEELRLDGVEIFALEPFADALVLRFVGINDGVKILLVLGDDGGEMAHAAFAAADLDAVEFVTAEAAGRGPGAFGEEIGGGGGAGGEGGALEEITAGQTFIHNYYFKKGTATSTWRGKRSREQTRRRPQRVRDDCVLSWNKNAVPLRKRQR